MVGALWADVRPYRLLGKDEKNKAVGDRNGCVVSRSPFSLGGSVLRKIDEIGPRLEIVTNQASRRD